MGGRCTNCGIPGLEQGWVMTGVESQKGLARWIAGPFERGFLGIAKYRGRPRLEIDAYRCRGCGHLDLFAIPGR